MKGQLPPTGKMILESEESQWRMLVRGLINELITSAIIERPGETKVRIRLIITEIMAPENKLEKTRCVTLSNLQQEMANGLSRISEYVVNLTESNKWIFIGRIEGEEKKPIIIAYYPVLQMTVYSQKLAGESVNNFSPFTSLN